jgi:predicted porin
MQQKLLAAAIAAVLATPIAGMAQTTVTVYGKLYPQITSVRVSDGTAPGTPVASLATAPSAALQGRRLTTMDASNSRIGFRGTEKLGDGLTAIFQLEGAFGVDNGTLNTSGVLFDQDTFVGLSGSFGTVKLGLQDTVYKNLGDRISFPRGLSSGNNTTLSHIIGKQGFGGNNAARFHERLPNTIKYESPVFSGFQIMGSYALGEQVGSISTGSTFSGGVSYLAGPLYLAVAHEIHNDFFGGSLNMPNAAQRNTAGKDSKDTATRLTARYSITNDTRLEGDFARIEYDETGPAAVGDFRNYKHNTWALALQQDIDAFTLQASFGKAGAGSCRLQGVACNTSGMDGKMLVLGGVYSLSKRTGLYAVFTRMDNGPSAAYSNLTRQGGGRTGVGSDINQVSLGIAHDF